MRDAFICDGVRTPVGRYGGALSAVRADDLGAIPLRALLERYPQLDPERIDDVIFGCANGRGRQPQRGAYGVAAGRAAADRLWHDDQPPVRLGAGCGWLCCTRHKIR